MFLFARKTNGRATSAVACFLLMFFIGSFTLCSAQSEDPNNEVDIVLPDHVMNEVVRRILIWSFKPSRHKKVIYIADLEIKKDWLPTIKNIEFKLISLDQIDRDARSAHFFRKPRVAGAGYNIGFAFGDPQCDYEGYTWMFRVAKRKVRLWQSGGFGAVCSRSFNSA